VSRAGTEVAVALALWYNTARVPKVTHGNDLDSGYTKKKIPIISLNENFEWKADNESLSNFAAIH
jgi:hypothetical protein